MAYKRSILKAISILLGLGTAAGLGAAGTIFAQRKAMEKGLRNGDIYKAYYRTLYEWFEKKKEGKCITDYFKEKNYKNIAIYGRGTLGTLLYEELEKSEIKVSFWIEKDTESWDKGIGELPVVGISEIDEQPAVDAIIVTPISHFYEIDDTLEGMNIAAEIVSLEEVVRGM